MHGRAVGLVPLCGKAGCKSLVEDSGFIGHTACSRKNQRGEGSVLDLSNALLIGTLLQGLLFFDIRADRVHLWEGACGLRVHHERHPVA